MGSHQIQIIIYYYLDVFKFLSPLIDKLNQVFPFYVHQYPIIIPFTKNINLKVVFSSSINLHHLP
jgi:hypothetical protein